MWAIDRELFEVWPSMAIELGVEIGKYTPLEKWIFSEVNAAYNVAWLELEIDQNLSTEIMR